MAFAIQWNLRDNVHCMDIYARPGRMDISAGLVYYSTCTGIQSPNYSDVIVGVSTMTDTELAATGEEKYYTCITKFMDPKHMKVNAFVHFLRSNKTNTVGSIRLIESTVRIAVELLGAESVNIWAASEEYEANRVRSDQRGTHFEIPSTQETFNLNPQQTSEDTGDAQMERLKKYILGLSELGVMAEDFGKSDDSEDYEPLSKDDTLGIIKNALLKLWYVMKMYRAMFFVFKEPVVQLDRWFSKVTRPSASLCLPFATGKLTTWAASKVEVKKVLGRQHSVIKRIWNTEMYRENQEMNKEACSVLVHTLHVLDNAKSAYSIVPSISKAECRTRVMHLTKGGIFAGWRDVTNKEFFTYNPIVQSISNINLLSHSRKGIHGIVYDSTFRICDPDPKVEVLDSRLIKTGKLCSTIDRTKLMFILATFYVRPTAEMLASSAVQKTRKPRRSKVPRSEKNLLSMQKYTTKLDPEQSEIFGQWNSVTSVKVSVLCCMVKKAMVEANRVFYYNIQMN